MPPLKLKFFRKNKNKSYTRLDANYQIDLNMAPDVDFTFLYLKNNKYIEKPPRYGFLPLPKLKTDFFR